jgi:hypothetical protein
MANRNFNASAIAAILQSQTAANNANKIKFFVNNAVNQLSKNSEINDYDATANTDVVAGSQTYFQKGGLTNTIIGPPEQFITTPIPPPPPPPPPIYNTKLYFTEVGSFSWTAPGQGPIVIRYVVVGGGGGAGGSAYAACGGGGGAGQVLIGNFNCTGGTTYTGFVGDGGAGGTGVWDNSIPPYVSTTDGNAGVASYFNAIIAQGGTGGKKAEFTGSGTQTGGKLNMGGGGGNGPIITNGGGGGGGNGSPGDNAVGAYGGAGGSGKGNDINTVLYGAGGAGGTSIPPAIDSGGASGFPNTGNGGNALNITINYFTIPKYSGNGGSGIIILAYS